MAKIIILKGASVSLFHRLLTTGSPVDDAGGQAQTITDVTIASRAAMARLACSGPTSLASDVRCSGRPL